MSTTTVIYPTARQLGLADQNIVVIGGSAGIGLATARRARAEGANLILTGRDHKRLSSAAVELDPLSVAAFDATDHGALRTFFDQLTVPVDHVMVTAGGSYYAPLADIDDTEARRSLDQHLWLMIAVARLAAHKVRPGGTLLFMSGTGPRHPAVGLSVAAASVGAGTAVTGNLALELAPVRVNLIAAGFVDTPLSATLLGEGLDARRAQLRAELPIRRVVTADDVAALAVHLMSNTAITGATFDIDGGQQLLGPVGG